MGKRHSAAQVLKLKRLPRARPHHSFSSLFRDPLKGGPVLLSSSQARPGRKFSQPRAHLLVEPCTNSESGSQVQLKLINYSRGRPPKPRLVAPSCPALRCCPSLPPSFFPSFRSNFSQCSAAITAKKSLPPPASPLYFSSPSLPAQSVLDDVALGEGLVEFLLPPYNINPSMFCLVEGCVKAAFPGRLNEGTFRSL